MARSEGIDPAIVVAETVDAVTSLRPTPSELVPLCRNLVERNPTCGPLWWLCARLLAKPEGLADAWHLVDEIEGDDTPARLADALPDDVTVLTVGYPAMTARALRRRAGVSVVAGLAGEDGGRLVRAMDRAGVDVEPVLPEAMLDAMRRVDLVLLEADACSTVVGRRPDGQRASPPSPRRRSACRSGSLPDEDGGCPSPFVEAIGRRLDAEHEEFPTSYVRKVAGPEGVVPMSSDALAGRVPGHPRTALTLTDGCFRGPVRSPKHPSVVQRWAAAGARRRRVLASEAAAASCSATLVETTLRATARRP